MTLKFTPSQPGLLLILSEKIASFSSLIHNGLNPMILLPSYYKNEMALMHLEFYLPDKAQCL